MSDRPPPVDPTAGPFIGWWRPAVGGRWVALAAADTDTDAWAAPRLPAFQGDPTMRTRTALTAAAGRPGPGAEVQPFA
jgi:hypothetical protein